MNLGFVAGRGPQGYVCFLGEDFMGKNKRIKGQETNIQLRGFDKKSWMQDAHA